ncbi:MAG: HNH endonuclease [Flavobacterium sp.]|nr:HNH endonuclease [Flavobacterium sp.]
MEKNNQKTLLEEVIDSSSQIHRLISKLKNKEKYNSPIKYKELCYLLNINLNQLKELFKAEKINYVENSSMQISVQKLIKLKTKIEVIIRDKHIINIYDKSLRELMINSESFLSILEGEKENVSLLKIATTLNLGIQHICKLFEFENIIIEANPNAKISCDLLRHILLSESEISLTSSIIEINKNKSLDKIDEVEISNEEKFNLLKNKIQSIDVKKETRNVLTTQFVRNEYIREYARVRADGICELCYNPAPFIDYYGNPFLETHHVIFLSKGGADSIDNVVAICPNCHRKIHNLNLEEDVNKLLEKLKNHKLQE